MATTTIDYNKLTKKSYSYNVKKVDTIILQNFDDFEGQVDTISASGTTLTVKLNNNKTLKFTSIPNPNNINFTGSYTNTMQEFYDATFAASWIPAKGTAVNGSVFDENIDVHLYENAKNKGLTIKSQAGDDNITATKYNDAITGGAGENTIIYDSSFFANGFGDDTVTLTKGETLNITFTDDYTLSYSQAKTKSNLLVTVKSGDVVKGTITLKNYYSKETGATVIIDGINLAKEHILPEVNAENYFQVAGQKVKTSYTGTALADTVDGSGYIAKNKDGSENIKNTKGLTLKGGAGDDIITGSKYIDTIKGGNGDDTIKGGKGNDKLYGEGGENTFVFNKGDNNDIVYGGKGTDTLNFSDSIDLTFEQVKKDLVIRYNKDDEGVAQDSVTIKSYYNGKGKVVSSVKYITLLGKTYEVEVLRELMADPNFQIVVNEDYEVPEAQKDENQVIIVENDDLENPINIITKDGDDTIYGSENGVSNINAGNGDNEVHGGNGGTITTGTGDDTIYGGTNNVIESGSGNDTIYGGEGGTIDAGTGNDTIYGGNGNEINAGVGEDEIYAGTNNIIDAGAGNDTVYGGEGGTIDGGSGDDTIYTGNAESVNGGAGDDIIHTEGDSNEIHIGNNNGNDTIIFDEKQEEGNTIVFDDKTLAEVEDVNTGITFSKEGDNLVIGTGGDNTVTLDDYLNQNNENISETIIEGSDGESTTLTEIINDKGIDIEGTGEIQGTQYKDNITGSDNNDTISAGIGNDNVNAGAGNDTIYGNAEGVTGGTGSNVIDGGAGNDTIHLQEAHNEVHFNGNYGNDTLVYDEHQENGNTIVFDDKTLEQIEDENTGIQITKDGDDIIVDFKDGSNNSVKIEDYLNAEAQEKLSETVIKGSDGANSTTLAEIIEEKGINITGEGEFSGTQYKDNITGSENDDTIDSGAGNDTINSGAGDDIIKAGTGNDTVNGGAGADLISGGAGNDTINGGAGDDVIYGNDDIISSGTGSNIIDGGAGNDTIHLQEAHNEVHFSGNFGQDTVIFDNAQENGNDVVFEDKTLAQINENATFSKSGDDLTMSFEGEAGNSVTFKDYFDAGNENITETTVKGSDGATQSTNIDSMLANATITVTGAGDISGTQYKDNITGSANDDIINAGAGADIVDGGEGDDEITGGAGDDTLSGGTGENTFIFSSGDGVDHILDATNDDVIRIDSVGEIDIEQITEDDVKKLQITYNGGTVITNYDFVNPENTNIDTVMVKQADGSYQEISIKENVIVPVEVDGDYNKTSDLKENLVIADDAGDITVTGLTVKDKITFAEGNDPEYSLSEGGLVVEGDTTTVTVTQAGADMTHRVFVNGVADDLSDKTLTVTGLENFDGSDLGFGNYDVTGTDEQNILITGDGNDTIDGGAGGDILAAGGGDDVVNGGDGNDVILGEAGNDTLSGGAGSDQFTFAKGHGHDVITDSTNDDTITFDTTISGFDNISFARGTQPGQTDTSLYITYGDNENPDTIEVQNYFVNDGEKYIMSDTAINTVALGTIAYDLEWKASPSEEEEGMYLTIKAPDDGQPYTIPAVEGIKNDITGNTGDNIITGSAQNDIITGGQGDDTINAGEGYNKICYNLGDGDDTILNGDGTDTLTFAEGTKVVATYGTTQETKNDLIITYSAEDGTNSGTITLKDYKDGHSVQSVKIGDGEAQDIADLISIGQINYYGPFGDTFPYRAAFGTDDSETLTSEGGEQFENYHSYGGNDKIAIQATFDNDGTPQNVENDIYFKPGDGNDTILNAERIQEGAAPYSNEQAEYQERLFKPVAGNPRVSELTFVNVRLDDITTERDGDDLILHYTDNDSVRIKGGYYSTYIGKVGTYTDSGTGRKLYYGDGEPGSPEWIATRQEITDYYQDTDGESETESARLSDIVEGETISGDGDLNGWIWKDTITGGDGADNINGHNGNDTIDGGAGNDTIYGGSDNDTIYGGDGDDVIYGYRALLDGETVVNKNLTEEGYVEDNDTIYGGAGNDTIYGGLGNDTIDGGAGDDTIYGPQYEDNAGWTNFIASTIKGGTGSDTIIGQGTIYADDVTINGNTVTDVEAGAGNDNILGAGTIYAGYGDDTISYRGGYTITPHWWMPPQFIKGYLYAGEGNDTITLINDDRGIYTNFYNDAEVYAGAGDDKITGQAMTLIDGGAGNDRIDIVQAYDYNITSVTDGGEGNDIVEFTRHTNRFDLGNHTIRNSGGEDTVLINKVPFYTEINNGGQITKSAPAAFLDLTIDDDGNIISTGTDVYMAYSEDFGDKEKSLKFEGVLTEEGIETEIFDNIYIKNQDSLYWNYNESGANLQHGYRTLNIENLKTALAEYLHNNTEFTSLSDALENGGEEVKTALADIAQDLDGNYGIWEYSLYRPTYTDEDGVVHSIFNSDDEGVYGDSTDQTLTSHFDPYYRPYDYTKYVSHNEFIVGGSGNETINLLSFGNDLIYGGAGNDTINAIEGNDTILGEEGTDTLNAGDGDDNLIGGVGNDTLSGGEGEDKFYFSAGDGKDVVTDATNADALVFAGVDETTITMTQKSTKMTSLFVGYGDNGDEIEIENYFVKTPNPDYPETSDQEYIYPVAENAINKFGVVASVMNDNHIVNVPEEYYTLAMQEPIIPDVPQSILNYVIGDDNDNILNGTNLPNQIEGRGGNDTITGGSSADKIYGGTGNDVINGGLGNNSIYYAVGDGDDTILNGGGTDTLTFAEGTKVVATYGTGEHAKDLVVTYSAEDGTNSGTITLKDYKDGHSVQSVKIGDGEAQSVTDFITLGTTEFFNYYGDVWPILQRGVYGTDDDETLAGTATGIYANNQREGESYYTYGGDDKVVLRLTSEIGDLANDVSFKAGDDNDTIVNSQRIKEGAAEYSEEQAIYQEYTWNKECESSTKLKFRGVTEDDLDVQIVGNDIVINYTDNDSVTIKDGYYSTNVDAITTYELDPNYQQARTRLYYGDGEPGSEEWVATREVRETTDYGYGNQGTSYYNTVHLRDLISDKNIDNSQAETAQTAEGWIWKDTITASGHGDTIKGYSGNDILIGGAGNDTIDGGGDNDTITGGAGVDTIYGGDGKDNIDGGDGDDIINGYRNLRPGEVAYNLEEYADDDDIINGGAGDDTIYGGFGRDIINGGTGNDTIVGANFEQYDGNNLYLYSTINGGEGNDTITGSGVIHGDDGNDTISGNGKLYGDAGDDTITLTRTGVDMKYYTETTNPYIDGGEGNDTIIFSHNGNDFDTTPSITVLGGAGDDYIKRGTSANLDNLNIDAGSGNDHVYINNVNSTKNNTIEGGSGSDTVEFRSSLYANSSNDASVMKDSSGTDDKLLILGDNMGYFARYNAGTTYQSCPVAFFDMTIDGDGNVLTLGNDIYINSTYSDYLSQYSLSAYGNKTKSLKIEGALSGGDTFENIYIKNTEENFDYVNDTNIKHGYRRLNIENLKTKYIEYMQANGLTDLSTAIANSTHKAALAQIAMSDDVWEYSLYRPNYTDDNGAVHSYFESDKEGVYGDGTDKTLTSRYNYNSTYNVSHNEFIVGGSGNETINSLSHGNDLIYGGAGNDTINANEGNDTIYGEEGNDTINAGDGNDFIDGGAGNDTISGGAGNDTIIGGLGDDTLTGGASANTFRFTPGDGVDHITDANTTDVIQIDAVSNFEITKNNENKLQIAYDGGTIIIDNYDFDTTDNIDVLKIKQTDGTYEEFSIRENFFNTIEGTDGVDDLTGTANNDIITGKKADDTINAGLGRNSIRFALGDGGDIIANGGGTDTLVFEEGTKVTTSRSGDNLMVTYSALDGTNAATITVTDFYGEDEHSVQYIKIGGHTYSVNDFYSLSRGDEALTDLTVTADKPLILTLANPFGESNYQYTISTTEDSAQTFSLEYLENGRLVVTGDNLNIDASSGQADDIIIKGDYNFVDTGDRDDIVRLGGSIDSQTFVQSDGNIVDTGAGNDHVVYYGLQNDIDMGEGTSDSVLAVAQDSTSTVENAEYNRYMYENEPSTSVNGTITTFDQGSVGDCRLLAILESLGEKETFTNAVKITENDDTYTVQFKNYVYAGKANSVDIAKSELTGFTNAYGDLDVVLTDMALNKLLKANNDSFKMANMTYVETATYNKLGDYFYGQDKVTAALYDPSMAGLSYDYQARVVDMWNKFRSGEIKNLSVGFMCEDNLDLGIVSGHAYAVKNLVSGENGYITLVNVWDNKDVLNLDLATFYTLNANVYSYGQDYYGENLLINNVDPPIVREGTDGDDTFTATADNEIFNLHKGDDTVNFGADFGNDQINSEYEYNYDKGRKNIDTLNFSNYSINEGTLSVGADEEGDLVLTAASADGEHGGSVAYNEFAGGIDLPYVVVNDADTEYWAYGIPFQKQNNSAFYRFISTNSSANNHTNIISLSNGTPTKSEAFSTFHIQSQRYWEENKNVFVTSGGLNTDYWCTLDPYEEQHKISEYEDIYVPAYMPDDTVVTYDGDDSYEVRALNDRVKLHIVDEGGNDTIVINDDKLENLRLLFNVNADGSYDNVNMKIVNKNMIDGNNFESVYNSSSLGIRVEATAGSNGQGEGIENIYAYGHSVTNVKEWKDAVAEQVSAWLTANNFTDVEDALAHGTDVQITQLYEKFNTDYTATLDSRVISTIQTYQRIYQGYSGAGVRGIGTDGNDTIVPINARGTFYNFYTFEGDDTVILPGTHFSSFYSLDYGHESTIYFKPGDGNDTLLNSDIIADNDVKWSYSDAEVDKMQKVLDRNDGTVCTTDLCFKDVAPENLTVTPDGNDILITYTTNTTTDTVRIKDGMYSTNIRNIVTYTTDYEPPVEPEPNGYYLYEDGEMVWHDISGEYNEGAKGEIYIGQGSYEEVDIYKETSNRELQDILTVDPISNIGGEAATLKGWIWKDNITAGDNGDTIYGCGGNDTLTGGTGDDTIYGGYGTDTINGGAGNDIIYGDSPVAKDEDRKYTVGDIIDGGDGDDRIYGASTYTGGKYRWADANISGGAGNDKITGAGTIDGGDGDDFVKFNEMQTYNTPQTISGGNGNDTIVGHGQQNLNANVLGGAGNDYFLVSSNYKDRDEGNELERIDLISGAGGYNSGVRPAFMGTVDMGAGNDHVRISKTQYALTVDGGVDNDVIEVAAPSSVSDYKNIIIKNSGGHDAVNLVSTVGKPNFDYYIETVYDEGQYIPQFVSAPIAFFDMEKVNGNWTYGDDIYVCSSKPSTYDDEPTYQYIGDKDKSIKFENGLVDGHGFDIYIKNNEEIGANSTYHYENGYRILDINALKEGYKATLTTLGYTSLYAALNEADADKQAANREALATIAMAEDVWVYTLDRPAEFSLGNFYNGSGGSQYYQDMAVGTGANNALVAVLGQYIHNGDSFLAGTDANEFIYSTMNAKDVIRAGGGDDVIYGGQGDDQIYAGSGNNRIVFCNNYYLERGYSGGYGNPLIYTLREGATGRTATDGHDTVYNDGGSDTLDFSENNMVKFEKVGRDLRISYTFEAQEVEEVLTDVATSTVTVKDYFLANGDIDENHSAKYIKFRNRGVVNLADEYVASSGNKYLWSTTPEGENLQGGATTEFIYGGSGNDTLSGGLYLDGGKGNDRYDVSACTTLAPIVISDSGCEQNTIYLDIHKDEFGAFYDVTATKTGETVNTKLGDTLHIFNQNNGYNATGGLIVNLGYTSLLDEDFDTSGYDNEVRINQSKQYSTNYTIYSQELNGHYHTSSISNIISETQSWLTANYDDVAEVLGEENVSTANLMASTADGAAALKADLINQINSHIYWT